MVLSPLFTLSSSKQPSKTFKWVELIGYFKYHLLGLRRQLISLLFWGYKYISMRVKYPEVWNIRFVSIEYFNGCLLLMTTHRLLIMDMQDCFKYVLPERSRQTSILLYGFSFFNQSSIECLCTTVLLGYMGNWNLMSDAFGHKEWLKLFAQEFPPTVWTYRGEWMTSKGFSPMSHRLKMLCSSIFVMYECNKCITGMIVDECKNILGM